MNLFVLACLPAHEKGYVVAIYPTREAAQAAIPAEAAREYAPADNYEVCEVAVQSTYEHLKAAHNALNPQQVLTAKPTPILAERYNGSTGQEGVAPGQGSYEWHGLPVWNADQWLCIDEHGQRQVLTTAALERYYQ